MNKVEIGNATLYLADCMEVLPKLARVDAIITDPPYGIKRSGQPETFTKNPKHKRRQHSDFGWDDGRPPDEVFDAIRNASDVQIIWGGNYFADILPPTMRWLVWDKGQHGLSMSDGELAWTSMQSALRICTMNRVELLSDGVEHPTQKPLKLMKWCIEQCTNKPKTVLDPYMGSGTTGVAAVQMGRKFIGIEREPKYFEIACKRIEQAQRQGDMFLNANEKQNDFQQQSFL